VWVVGGTRYVCGGTGNREVIAVSYRSGDEAGLAMYGEGGNWKGHLDFRRRPSNRRGDVSRR
jgi:hypothetical protein